MNCLSCHRSLVALPARADMVHCPYCGGLVDRFDAIGRPSRGFDVIDVRIARLDDDGNPVGDFEDGAVVSGIVEHAQDPSHSKSYLAFPAPSGPITFDAHIVDYDTLAAALGLPDPLDLEREELANYRANRQTLAWRWGMDEHGRPLPTPHDPTSILDAADPWLP